MPPPPSPTVLHLHHFITRVLAPLHCTLPFIHQLLLASLSLSSPLHHLKPWHFYDVLFSRHWKMLTFYLECTLTLESSNSCLNNALDLGSGPASQFSRVLFIPPPPAVLRARWHRVEKSIRAPPKGQGEFIPAGPSWSTGTGRIAHSSCCQRPSAQH